MNIEQQEDALKLLDFDNIQERLGSLVDNEDIVVPLSTFRPNCRKMALWANTASWRRCHLTVCGQGLNNGLRDAHNLTGN